MQASLICKIYVCQGEEDILGLSKTGQSKLREKQEGRLLEEAARKPDV